MIYYKNKKHGENTRKIPDHFVQGSETTNDLIKKKDSFSFKLSSLKLNSESTAFRHLVPKGFSEDLQ